MAIVHLRLVNQQPTIYNKFMKDKPNIKNFLCKYKKQEQSTRQETKQHIYYYFLNYRPVLHYTRTRHNTKLVNRIRNFTSIRMPICRSGKIKFTIQNCKRPARYSKHYIKKKLSEREIRLTHTLHPDALCRCHQTCGIFP